MKTLLSKLLVSLAFALALPVLAAPMVSLTAPTNGNLYLAPATFAVKANASATGVGINRVEFYANGVLINTNTASPYQFDWTSVAAGTYSITAKAVDNNGAETMSAARSVTVSATNTAPTVSLSAPADGSRYLNPSSISLSANASGPELNDILQRVEFYVDGSLAGSAASAPYTFLWTSPAIGTHTVTAVATDSQGSSTTSAARTVIVSNQNQAPTVSIVTPTDNSLWHSPASFMFQANASSGEANDTVTVQFYVNGVLQGSDSTSPYSINLSSLAAGTYTLMARAIDGQSAQTDSVTRTITVSDTNAAPTVTISTPTNNANYPMAPAGFTINATASAGEVNGWVTKVEFYVNGNLVNTDTAGPWSYAVSGLANGTYTVTAKAFDQLDASTSSPAITVTVGPQPKMYFLQVDHLNTPRLITNASQQVVWRHDNAEPFGDSPPDENPSGLGASEFPLRDDGTYADKETGLLYNWNRYRDNGGGHFLQADPLGVRNRDLSLYVLRRNNPLRYTDPDGLDVSLHCRPVIGTFGRYSHCFVHVTCPKEGIDEVLSLFGKFPYGVAGLPAAGYKSSASSMEGGEMRDDPSSAANNYNKTITPQGPNCNCDYEKSVLQRFYNAPATQPYGGTGSNSNTFAQDLIMSPSFGTNWPSDAPSNAVGTLPIRGGRIQ